MELFNPNSNINFMGWRRISVAISSAADGSAVDSSVC